MKKQRILALALTATMAMSVFGGMSASAAADPTDGYQSYTAKTGVDWDTTDLETIYTGSYEDAMVDGFDANTIYLFDYVDDGDTGTTDYDDVIAAIEAALIAGENTTGSLYTAAVTALNTYYGESPAADNNTSIASMSDTREAVIDLFEAAVETVNGMEKEFYDAGDWEYYGVDAMKSAASTIKVTNANSEMLNFVAEVDRITPELYMTTTQEEAYYELYDYVSSLPDSDYTASNYRKITRLLEDAEDVASAGTEAKYKEAIGILNGYKTVQTVTPDWSDLKAAVEGLFTDGKPLPGEYKGTPSTTYYYTTDDYDKTSYEWVVFAGGKYDGETIKGAYETAYEVYQDCRYASTRKYVGQSVVDNALADLDDALLNLDPNFSSKNWVVVMLEDALDSANEIVESDYRTNSSYWRAFVSATERIESLLEATAVRESVATDAVSDLEDAIKALTKCQVRIDADMRDEMTAAKREANALLKDKSNKTASQILALEAALKTAEDTTTSATVSVYEAALNDLQTAITGYSQVQGWYQQNGTWYYGVGDTTAKGWLNLNGTWYYLDPTTGAMATGWLQLGSTWYYLKDWGGMATGWQQVNGSWYYFQSWGGMVSNGWYWIGGSCYYFYNWGGMAANTTIDGYTVNASGAWVR